MSSPKHVENSERGRGNPKSKDIFLWIPHHKNAKRSLASEFANCGQNGPPVDPWVKLDTGLKDLNTIVASS